MANVIIKEETNFHPETFPVVAAEEIRSAMGEAVELRRDAVERNAPRDTGAFQSSIHGSVAVEGDLTRGDVFSDDVPAKVESIESGSRPGTFRPVEALRSWAAARGMNVFAVQRAIQTRGTPARRPFEKGASQTEAESDAILLDRLPLKIIERV
jgi:hypothetical protein